VLWYKAWLETRARFLTFLATVTAVCGNCIQDLVSSRKHKRFGKDRANVQHNAHTRRGGMLVLFRRNGSQSDQAMLRERSL
jgi:hypothetical protein